MNRAFQVKSPRDYKPQSPLHFHGSVGAFIYFIPIVPYMTALDTQSPFSIIFIALQ